MRLLKSMFAVLSLFLIGGTAFAQMPQPRDRQVSPSLVDIAYADAQPTESCGHLLDLYFPAGQSRQRPLVIWTGGSAFLGDNGKDSARFMAPELVEAGFVVAGVSIRSSSQVHFPGQLHDIKAAIRFLRRNAARYGIDPNRIAIMGDSSGGWTTAMAAVTGDAPEMEGTVGTADVSSAVQAAIAFYPPTDFLAMDTQAPTRCIEGMARPGPGMCHDLAASPESLLIGCSIQSCPDAVRAADPARYVSAGDPPIMILHGRADPLVPFGQGEHLFKTLTHNCRTAVLYALPLAGHGPAWSFLEGEAARAGAAPEALAGQKITRETKTVEAPQ
jgi:acetyl esterase/lipase